MSFLFGRRPRTNTTDLPKQAKDQIQKLDGPTGPAKAEELAKTLAQMKFVLQGTQDTESSPEQVHQLVTGMIEEDLLYLLAINLYRLPFESRKDATVIFSYVLRFRPATASPKSEPMALSYVINNRPEVLVELCNGYEHKESATPAGTVLREVLKSDSAAAIILYDDPNEDTASSKGLTGIQPEAQQSGNGVFWKFFRWIDQGSFEVGADAFTTFRELLTKHKQIVAQYLATNFDLFFDQYNNILVKSESYVTKRQSIKLLGEILLDRANYNVMTAYVDRGEHLKICMNLLRDERKMVQYEGFHVFKVFVANPHKSSAVHKILLINRDRLLTFLQQFLEDRTDDEQFIDEREFLIKQIKNMLVQFWIGVWAWEVITHEPAYWLSIDCVFSALLLSRELRLQFTKALIDPITLKLKATFVRFLFTMQPGYRSFPQQAQRSPHNVAQQRRGPGIGPMVNAHQNSMTAAQMQAQAQAVAIATDKAKMKSKKPTDRNIPEGVEDCVIGDGVERYRDLVAVERRLDAIMMRKRLDVMDGVNRNIKTFRTLRVWISNTVEDQPWQADTLDMDAFDFSTNMDSSYRVKIEGRLLDDPEEDSDESDDEADADNDPVDEDGKERKKSPSRQFKFSHFFKVMTVDFDRNRIKDGADQNVEWKKPNVGNSTNLPNAADFDQLEFKRGGDENVNITINLVRDEVPERFQLNPSLAAIMDTNEATRAEVVMGIWDYIKAMGLQEDDEKRAFDCDDLLRPIMGRDKGYIPLIPDAIVGHMAPLPPVRLPYTIRVDKEFHDNPEPTIYDIRVQVDDPLKTALHSYIANPAYSSDLREISDLNNHVAVLTQAIMNSKSKHTFFDQLAKNPTEFILKWLSSQNRDLEIIAGEAMRGGGDFADGDEWRLGGEEGVWGRQNVRQSVGLMVSKR
ncbi:hypothetical protein B7494_g2364 [Chlorociboria aeruginascens]|nr:hypothetical protein B7494_g2364 [Chlorociboria aeruginascens]